MAWAGYHVGVPFHERHSPLPDLTRNSSPSSAFLLDSERKYTGAATWTWKYLSSSGDVERD